MNYPRNSIVPVEEARKILGKIAEEMLDNEIAELVENLDVIAIDALRQAHEKRMEEDAVAMANLIYDIYKDYRKNKE